MHYYLLYHLTIASDLQLPELISISDTDPSVKTPDVTITQGEIDEDGIVGGQQLGPFLYTDKNLLWLSVPPVSRYLVKNGQEIIYDPTAGADEASIRLFLLGSAIGAILFQRGYLVLHGNAFRIGDASVLCVGHSGAGKSTLAAAMMQRGYEILADDVCPIDQDAQVIPGMPRIKLWQDTADKLGIDTSSLQRVRPHLEKFNYPLNGQFCSQALPVEAIYILNASTEDCISIETLSGLDVFKPLKENTYRFEYMKGMELSKSHLQQCGKLASKVRVAQINRPIYGFKMDELMDSLINDFETSKF